MRAASESQEKGERGEREEMRMGMGGGEEDGGGGREGRKDGGGQRRGGVGRGQRERQREGKRRERPPVPKGDWSPEEARAGGAGPAARPAGIAGSGCHLADGSRVPETRGRVPSSSQPPPPDKQPCAFSANQDTAL